MKALTDKAHKQLVKKLRHMLSILGGESKVTVELENRRRSVINAATAYVRFLELRDKGEMPVSRVEERLLHLRGAVGYLIKAERAHKQSRDNQKDWLEEHFIEWVEEEDDDADHAGPIQQQQPPDRGEVGSGPGLVDCKDPSGDRS